MLNCRFTRCMEILMRCPACHGQFTAPLGKSEGGCVYCGVQLRVDTGIRVMSVRSDQGTFHSRKWKDLRHSSSCGTETRPMFLIQNEDEEKEAVAIF
jgi:hypothetical protein